jgi:hypothetical protein
MLMLKKNKEVNNMSDPSLGLNGPYNFNSATIDERITQTSPGNYALGYKSEDGTFIVLYVGRADVDLNERLHQQLGKSSKYKYFKWGYSTSRKAAFEKECQNYHDFKCPDNQIHPDRPDGANWECPRCDIFD